MIETMTIKTPILVEIETDEITALCPINDLPDFGSLKVQYMADTSVVELKSFKEFLATYRDQSISQEDFAATILENIRFSCNPSSIHLELEYKVRGGIKTIVTLNYSRPEQTPTQPSETQPKTRSQLLHEGQVGVLTIEDCCTSVSTPVNFVVMNEYVYFVVDSRSRKGKMLRKTEQGTFVIHHEYPEPENWQKTSSLILSGPIYKVSGELSHVRAYFRDKYPWYINMEELCQDELDKDIIICLNVENEIYSTGDGIMNEGGQ